LAGAFSFDRSSRLDAIIRRTPPFLIEIRATRLSFFSLTPTFNLPR
jgi:hypothetical protein